MIDQASRGNEKRSWLWVVLCSLAIFATVPLARVLQRWVSENLGDQAFILLTVVLLGFAGVWTITTLRRSKPRSATGYLWLLAVAAAYGGLIWNLSGQAAEVLHLLEYGLLGALCFSALAHRMRNRGIYLAATLMGAIVGILDEALQWATPNRYWELRDIAINVVATGLVQVAIAGGLRPPWIKGWPDPRSAQILFRLALAVWLLLTLSIINTPERIAWYAERVPGLAFLLKNQSVMIEYGYRYEDPEAGVFRSRLTPQALRQSDQERAGDVAPILDTHREDDEYYEFLRSYTPANDPFVHEARVHLFRRDRHIRLAKEALEGSRERRRLATIAYRETEIMRRYFPKTYTRSTYQLSAEDRLFLEANLDPDMAYDSRVSRTLITEVGEGFFIWLLGGCLLGLVLVRVYYGRRR